MGFYKRQQELKDDGKILFNRVIKQITNNSIDLDAIPFEMVLNLINQWSMTTINADEVKNTLKKWINTK